MVIMSVCRNYSQSILSLDKTSCLCDLDFVCISGTWEENGQLFWFDTLVARYIVISTIVVAYIDK